jgi:hypothetical protein
MKGKKIANEDTTSAAGMLSNAKEMCSGNEKALKKLISVPQKYPTSNVTARAVPSSGSATTMSLVLIPKLSVIYCGAISVPASNLRILGRCLKVSSVYPAE